MASYVVAPPSRPEHGQEGQWGFGLLLRAPHNLPEFPKREVTPGPQSGPCGKRCEQSSVWCQWRRAAGRPAPRYRRAWLSLPCSCCLPPLRWDSPSRSHPGVPARLYGQHGRCGGTGSGWDSRGAASGCGCAGTALPRALWRCPAGGGLSAARRGAFGTG